MAIVEKIVIGQGLTSIFQAEIQCESPRRSMLKVSGVDRSGMACGFAAAGRMWFLVREISVIGVILARFIRANQHGRFQNREVPTARNPIPPDSIENKSMTGFSLISTFLGRNTTWVSVVIQWRVSL